MSIDDPDADYSSASDAYTETIFDVALWRRDLQDWDLRGNDFLTRTEAQTRAASMRINRPHLEPEDVRVVQVVRSITITELEEF